MRAKNVQPTLRIGCRTVLLAVVGLGLASLAVARPDSLDPYDTVEKNVRMIDQGLAPKLEVTRVGAQPGKNGLLSVFAGFRNKTDHVLNLDIQTIYKDGAGDALNTSSWIPITIDPRGEQSYRSSAISDEAVGFIILIRVHIKMKP